MPDTITLPQAAHEFGLDARTVARIRRVLGRRGRVGHLLERANVIVYERALVVATIHADQERQRMRADRERLSRRRRVAAVAPRSPTSGSSTGVTRVYGGPPEASPPRRAVLIPRAHADVGR